MSEQKLRRKTMLFTLGAAALGWVGLGAAKASAAPRPASPQAPESRRERVRPEPRAVPYSDSKL